MQVKADWFALSKQSQIQNARDTAAKSKSKPHLLVVDDDRDLCHLLKQHLEPEGFTVSGVHNGVQGTKAGIEGGYELIVLDVMLPDKK
jgi:CheY-like chemotaxis protein